MKPSAALDLQRGRGAAEFDQPVLYAAVAGRVGAEGAGFDRVFVRAVAGTRAVGVVPAVGVGGDVEVFAAGDALNAAVSLRFLAPGLPLKACNFELSSLRHIPLLPSWRNILQQTASKDSPQ